MQVIKINLVAILTCEGKMNKSVWSIKFIHFF